LVVNGGQSLQHVARPGNDRTDGKADEKDEQSADDAEAASHCGRSQHVSRLKAIDDR
jgi:hypothetical protein